MMHYNTQEKKMALPEYGRSIQNMVDYAVTIPDKAERQRCANTIINIMGNMFPHLRDVPDFKHKLWDHLAIMSDFKLDIDYPYEIVRPESLHQKPDQIPYDKQRIRHRHYGRIMDRLIKIAAEMPADSKRDDLVALICNHLKKDYITWNKENVDDRMIANDLSQMSDGKLQMTDNVMRLMAERMERYGKVVRDFQPQQQNRNNKNQRNNRRRYNNN